MKLKNIFIIIVPMMLCVLNAYSQETRKAIEKTIQQYLYGSSYNKVNEIEEAFYNDAYLYLKKKDTEIWKVSSKEFASWFNKGKKGQFNGRIGNLLNVDYFNNIAIAKAEILVPQKNIKYVDYFLLKKLTGNWKIISKIADSKPVNYTSNRILFIVSNAHFYGSTKLATGNSYSEIVNAYDTFIKAGYSVDFVSPKGGSIPLAYINTSEELQKSYLYNSDFMYALKNTKSPDEINPNNYQAVHYIGGGSAMFGVPKNKAIQNIVMTIYEEQNGIISAVCHGTAGIVHLLTKSGKYLVEGKRVNGYPDVFENKDREYFKQFPFLIKKTIEEHNGIFKYSPRNTVHVEVDGNLITGQNYLSSKGVALKIIEKLNNR